MISDSSGGGLQRLLAVRSARNPIICNPDRVEKGGCSGAAGLISSRGSNEDSAMMGERAIRQESLFFGVNLDEHVPTDHLLRSIDRFVELSDIRRQLAPHYSAPSAVPRSTSS